MTKKNFFDFTVKAADGTDFDLSQFKGKTVLVINVASKCGFTPQYKGLEELYQNFSKEKFVVLGFPCNQFGGQEPGTESEIQQFCSLTYNVTFPVLAKVDVNGEKVAPIFEFMKKEAPGLLGTEAIKWNFTKFLIGQDGHVVKRYSPDTEPKNIMTDIIKTLG